MIFDNELLDMVARAVVLSSLALAWIVMVVRVIGLRAFSKMTAFDFVVTVATGSLLAGLSQASTWIAFGQAALAIACLLCAQWILARLRRSSGTVKDLLQNDPILLMRDGKMLKPALREARVAEADLVAKLREANVLDPSRVRAAVLETTGDISILHGERLDETLISNVRRVE